MATTASMSDLPDLLSIQNGMRAVHTFSAQEYANRIATLRRQMSVAQVDVVLFTSIHNINYYSDFLYCSFGRPYGLLVSQDQVTTISANIDAGQPWHWSALTRCVRLENVPLGHG